MTSRIEKKANISHYSYRERKASTTKDQQTTQAYVSLTSTVLKLAEDFVVEQYVAPAILNIVDSAQFGGIPRYTRTYFYGSYMVGNH